MENHWKVLSKEIMWFNYVLKGFPSAKIYMITSLESDPNCTCTRGEIMMACSRVTAMEMMRMMRFGIYFLIRMRNTWGFGITEERCCHRSSSLGDGVCVSEIWVPEFMGDWFQKWYMSEQRKPDRGQRCFWCSCNRGLSGSYRKFWSWNNHLLLSHLRQRGWTSIPHINQ